MSHGYSGSALPAEALRHLTSLQELDFSNNHISSMSDTSFHFLKNLRLLELHDNRIEQVLKGTFQGDIHSKLEEISLRFNHLTSISQHTFFDLEALRKLHLDDNKIDKVERRAFMNLDELEYLSLRGNKLNNLADESFQNLPKLEILDMAFNQLPNFNFDYFDQVGTLSNLNVNVSHNQIRQLMYNSSWSGRNEHGKLCIHIVIQFCISLISLQAECTIRILKFWIFRTITYPLYILATSALLRSRLRICTLVTIR